MASTSLGNKVYKILTPDEWDDWASNDVFEGAGIDIKDGYIHLSTDRQVVETYERYFKSMDVVLVAIDLGKVSGEVKWETSRNDQLFPHVYGKLQKDCVLSHKKGWDGQKPNI